MTSCLPNLPTMEEWWPGKYSSCYSTFVLLCSVMCSQRLVICVCAWFVKVCVCGVCVCYSCTAHTLSSSVQASRLFILDKD